MKPCVNFQSSLKTLLDNDSKQESLYHFTDINALFSIIQNNEIWLSERNYMNDVNDENFIKTYIRGIFKNIDNIEWAKFESELFPRKQQYIFSTSTEKDSIHQWTYYGSHVSYCIEFDKKKLIDFFDYFNKEDEFYYGPILYENKQTLEIANKVIADYTSSISEKYSIFNFDNDYFDDKRFEELKRIYQYFYSLIKQSGHSCEHEYRFLLLKECKPEFRIRNGLFVPYIKVNIGRKLPIKKIYLGPNCSEGNSKENLEFFLKNNNYEDVIVDKSEMKIRS